MAVQVYAYKVPSHVYPLAEGAFVCTSCGKADEDLFCLNCGAHICMACGAGDHHGDGRCCGNLEHCDCGLVLSDFDWPCLLSACFPHVAELVTAALMTQWDMNDE